MKRTEIQPLEPKNTPKPNPFATMNAEELRDAMAGIHQKAADTLGIPLEKLLNQPLHKGFGPHPDFWGDAIDTEGEEVLHERKAA